MRLHYMWCTIAGIEFAVVKATIAKVLVLSHLQWRCNTIFELGQLGRKSDYRGLEIYTNWDFDFRHCAVCLFALVADHGIS